MERKNVGQKWGSRLEMTNRQKDRDNRQKER